MAEFLLFLPENEDEARNVSVRRHNLRREKRGGVWEAMIDSRSGFGRGGNTKESNLDWNALDPRSYCLFLYIDCTYIIIYYSQTIFTLPCISLPSTLPLSLSV